MADDYPNSPSTLGTISIGGVITGNIETVGDTDWFKVQLVAGKTYRFDLEGVDTGRGSLVDPYASVRNPGTGTTKLEEDDNGGTGLNARFTFTATTTGTYFFAAGSSNNGTGTYRAAISDVTPTTSDDYANSPSTTGTVSVAGTRTGNIETVGDTDWLRVDLVGGHTYQFDLEGDATGQGTLVDPYLSVRNPGTGATKLKEDDNSGSGLNSRFTFTPTSDGTYFMAAGSSNGGTGSYRAKVTDVTPDDPPDTWTRPVALEHLPVSGGRVTQGFGGDTSHGSPDDKLDYYWIDFAANSSTVVRPVADGTVIGVRTGSFHNDTGAGKFGNYVTVLHANGLIATYAHLSVVSVSIDDVVTGGSSQLGIAGDTGRADAVHLHISFGTTTTGADGEHRAAIADSSNTSGSPAFFLSHFTSSAETLGYINLSNLSNIRSTDIFGSSQATDSNGQPYPNDQDELVGGAASNRIFGGSGNDGLWGLGGADTLVGGTGDDSARGGDNGDVLAGGNGADTLKGDAGDDTIIGGSGRDVMSGGADKDDFRFTAVGDSATTQGGADLITDFLRGSDRLDVSGIDANTSLSGDQKFALDAKGDATTAVARGHIGWYQVDASGDANDFTYVRLNIDADTEIETVIRLAGLVRLSTTDFIA